MTISIPGAAVDASSDLDAPLGALLKSLRLVDGGEASTTTSGATDSNTKPSLQVIEAGALSFSKKWSWTAIGTAVSAAASAVFAPIIAASKDASAAQQASIIAGCLFVVAAAIIALGMIVVGDVRARGVASAARLRGRADVATALIGAAGTARPPASGQGTASADLNLLLALAAFPERLKVARVGKPLTQVTGLERRPDGKLEVRTREDSIPIAEITSYET